jgi:hypothetical protein
MSELPIGYCRQDLATQHRYQLYYTFHKFISSSQWKGDCIQEPTALLKVCRYSVGAYELQEVDFYCVGFD